MQRKRKVTNKGTLYIAGTPIGNLKDITLRALDVFKKVDKIACEDTRVSSKLLRHFEIKKELISLHEHSNEGRIQHIINILNSGESIAYISDAGTPGISDPGGKLIEAAVVADIPVIPIPGVSAVPTILSISGIPTNSFSFYGYPPHKKGRQKFLDKILAEDKPVVIYESKYRIKKLLEELMKKNINDRKVILGNDLTKKFEVVERGSVSEILESDTVHSAKGEFVLVIAP